MVGSMSQFKWGGGVCRIPSLGMKVVLTVGDKEQVFTSGVVVVRVPFAECGGHSSRVQRFVHVSNKKSGLVSV